MQELYTFYERRIFRGENYFLTEEQVKQFEELGYLSHKMAHRQRDNSYFLPEDVTLDDVKRLCGELNF